MAESNGDYGFIDLFADLIVFGFEVIATLIEWAWLVLMFFIEGLIVLVCGLCLLFGEDE